MIAYKVYDSSLCPPHPTSSITELTLPQRWLTIVWLRLTAKWVLCFTYRVVMMVSGSEFDLWYYGLAFLCLSGFANWWLEVFRHLAQQIDLLNMMW